MYVAEEGPGNKESGSQSGLLPYMQRHDEAAGLDKLCQHGTTTGKITFLLPTLLAKGELQDLSWQVQGAEARFRDKPSPALVMHLQATAKISMQTLNRGGSHHRCLQRALWRLHEQPFIQRQMACKERQKHLYQHAWTGSSADGLSKVQISNEGEDHLLPYRQHNGSGPSLEGGGNS